MTVGRVERVLLALVLVASLVLVSGVANGATPRRRFVIATAGTAGALYPMGVAMAETINKHSDRFSASAESSPASVANIRNLDEGKVEWGIAQSEIASFAYKGEEIFKGKKVDGLQALFATVGSWVQIFVPADSPVRSIADLKGKKVGVGSPGSGGEVDARIVLSFYGLDYRTIKPSFMTDSEMVSALKDGTLDAMICTHPLKSAALLDLTSSFKVRMLSIADDDFYKEHPYFVKAKIPAGTYENVGYDVYTPYSRVIMFTHKNANFSEDDIFHLLDIIFSNRDEWRTAHASVDRQVKLETALESITVPLHPGAVKFFESKGIHVPVALKPTR